LYDESVPKHSRRNKVIMIHKNIIRAWDMLNDLSDKSSLQDKFLLINYILSIIHNNFARLIGIGDEGLSLSVYNEEDFDGNYLDALDFFTGRNRDKDSEEFLRGLSSGEHIPKWEEEMQMRASGNNWYKFAEMSFDSALETMGLSRDMHWVI